MDVANLPFDELDVISARLYGEYGYPHDAWTRLRRESPVHWSKPPGYRPFWAITKHADIIEISSQPEKFKSAGRRDEEIYPDAFAFPLDRDPNPHLGFGVGEHFCLGAHLARLDLEVFFRQFAERIEAIESAGPVEKLHASFVGGPKRVPIRFRMKPAG